MSDPITPPDDLDPLIVVLAGGRGTRLSTTICKALTPVDGKPLLEHTIAVCTKQGFRSFLFKTGHLSEQIEAHFGNGGAFGCTIDYLVERELLGTAGGLHALAARPGPTIILYSDVVMNVNLRAMLRFHRAKQAVATLAIHDQSDHPEDSDVILMGGDQVITKMIHKPGSREYGCTTNAALYVLEASCFSLVPETGPCDFGKEPLPKLVEGGRIYGYDTNNYMKDMGTPVRLREVEADIQRGRVFNEVDAVFLDRDGTINHDVDLLHCVEEFALLPGVGPAIARLNERNIPVALATNQPVVARGLCDEQTVQEIHRHMEVELARYGAALDAINYCPHHPEQRPEGRQAYRVKCSCRKPEPGMLEKFGKAHALRPERCFMVGDSWRDIEAGRRYGARTIFVETGLGYDPASNAQADYTVKDLSLAVDLILRVNRSSLRAIANAVRDQRQPGAPFVVAIGGAARAGKSTLAAKLRDELRELSVEIIGLDGWLVDVADRAPGSTVLERYRMSAIDDDLRSYLAGSPIAIRAYDRAKQATVPDRFMAPGAVDVLIVEGVPALHVPVLFERAGVRVFADASQATMRTGVLAILKSRGLSDEAAEAVVRERQLEEVPLIKQGVDRAHFIVWTDREPE